MELLNVEFGDLAGGCLTRATSGQQARTSAAIISSACRRTPAIVPITPRQGTGLRFFSACPCPESVEPLSSTVAVHGLAMCGEKDNGRMLLDQERAKPASAQMEKRLKGERW